MPGNLQTDVLIMGAGPAGVSTALHLVQADPAWRRRILLVDKAMHPREKLCGGGVTLPGEAILSRLGLEFEPAHTRVRELRFVYRGRAYALYGDPLFRITRRDEFDHWLLGKAMERGVEVRQGEAVTGITPGENRVTAVTENGRIRAGVLVGADGSFSLVRRKMKLHNPARMARTLETLTPETRLDIQNGVALFDVSPGEFGLQGYYWDFPGVIKGRPFMSRGVYDSRVHPKRPRASLKVALGDSLLERKRRLEECNVKSHPIYWFDGKGAFSRPRVILAGDAAGVDPFMGEGISFALGHGRVAASAIINAFQKRDFSFSDYKQRILHDPLLSQLTSRARLARFFYGLKHRWQFEAVWRLAPLLVRAIALLRPNLLPFKSSRLVKID
ncbi:MAG: NAD(P)/FAD-dependent oxidoreductase [Desulfobacterales bacterium]|nr:NAD(P)/FAD-dependent oxidoreductase [Desulfobacterales bacterium]